MLLIRSADRPRYIHTRDSYSAMRRNKPPDTQPGALCSARDSKPHPGHCPVASGQDSVLPLQGARAGSLVGELKSRKPAAWQINKD